MSGTLVDLLVPSLARSRSRVESPVAGGLRADEIAALGEAIAQALTKEGARPGEPVHVMIDNRPHDLAAFLGVWLAGGVVVPVHIETPPMVHDALRRRTRARMVLDGTGLRRTDDRLPRGQGLGDAALIVFTSGTTGRPKGVVLGHARLAGKLQVLGRLIEPSADDEVVLPLRLTFIFGIWVALLALITGARLTLLPRFTRAAVKDELRPGSAMLATVPTMLRILLADGEAKEAAPRTIVTGGETLPARLARTIRKAWPAARLFDLYGLSETGSCDFCLRPEDQPDGHGTIGHPTEGVVFRILDEGGRPVPGGGTGELQIKSPFAMLGYVDDPVLTAASFADGFFRTGDLARQDAAGRVQIAGRIKEIISRGGNKIAPAEIEAVLSEHPAVEAALCGSVPDPVLGEAVHVLVVARRGAAPDLERLRAWAASRIERYKLPDGLHLVDALPLGPTGKLDRQAVARLVIRT